MLQLERTHLLNYHEISIDSLFLSFFVLVLVYKFQLLFKVLDIQKLSCEFIGVMILFNYSIKLCVNLEFINPFYFLIRGLLVNFLYGLEFIGFKCFQWPFFFVHDQSFLEVLPMYKFLKNCANFSCFLNETFSLMIKFPLLVFLPNFEAFEFNSSS
jgi:hypothetical protein